jgi:hypothetical protein
MDILKNRWRSGLAIAFNAEDAAGLSIAAHFSRDQAQISGVLYITKAGQINAVPFRSIAGTLGMSISGAVTFF